MLVSNLSILNKGDYFGAIIPENFFNSEKFNPEEGYQESEWATLISKYFCGASQSREGQYLKIVAEAIKSLNLRS